MWRAMPLVSRASLAQTKCPVERAGCAHTTCVVETLAGAREAQPVDGRRKKELKSRARGLLNIAKEAIKQADETRGLLREVPPGHSRRPTHHPERLLFEKSLTVRTGRSCGAKEQSCAPVEIPQTTARAQTGEF